MDLIIFIIGGLLLVASLIALIVFVFTKKPKKKVIIGMGIGLVLMITGLSMGGTEPVDDITSDPGNDTEVDTPAEKEVEDVTYTDEEIAILSKGYKDLTSEEKEQIEVIDIKFIGLSNEDKEKYKPDLDRILKEKEDYEWEKQVAEKTKELITGEHIVGEHIEALPYDVTFKGNGNFVIKSKEGSLFTNEIGGSNGINKYRAILLDGSTIELKGMSAVFTPSRVTTQPYEEIELHAGYWVVGTDLTEGRYRAVAVEGSGNFVVNESNGMLKTNEILGSQYGVEEVIVNLKDKDIIQLSGLNKVKFIPEK